MKFKTMAIATAFIGCVLGLALEFAGATVMGRWGIQVDDGVLVLCRRIGALYIGLAVMFFVARSSPMSTARTALSSGAAVVLSLLAFLGVFEFMSSRATLGILPGALVEAFLALGFISTLYGERKNAKTALA